MEAELASIRQRYEAKMERMQRALQIQRGIE